MIAGAAAVLAVALAGAPQTQQWIAANRQSIAHVRDANERKARERIFAETVRELARERSAPQLHAAPDAAAVARSILRQSRVYRFGNVQKAPPRTWWDRLTDWIGARWRAIAAALFEHARLPGGTGVALGDILLGLAVGGFLFLVARVAWQYARPSVHGSAALAAAQTPDANVLFERAQRAAQSGRYTESITTIFGAALCELQRTGLLGDDPGQTVGELRRRVRRKEFDVLASAVTLAVYADAALGSSDWERAREAYLALAGQRGADAA